MSVVMLVVDGMEVRGRRRKVMEDEMIACEGLEDLEAEMEG